jgi:hypothetical protein
MQKNKFVLILGSIVFGLVSVSLTLPNELSLDGDLYRIKSFYIEAGALAIVAGFNLMRLLQDPIENNIKLVICALVLVAILDIFIANPGLFDLLFAIIYFSMTYLLYLIWRVDKCGLG